MGSCVSVHKNSESTMKLRLVFRSSKNGKLVIPSPLKNNKLTVLNNGDALPIDSQLSSPHLGSKEEIFFDSQPWLESDCEDDFYSIKGELSPSQGNTPEHQRFCADVNEAIFTERASVCVNEVLSPTDKKKKLCELFRETSLGGEQNMNVHKSMKYENGGWGGESSRGIELKSPERSVSKSANKSGQCCLPRLLSNEKRKKI